MAIGLSKWFKATFLGLEEKRVRARDEDGKYVGDDGVDSKQLQQVIHVLREAAEGASLPEPHESIHSSD